MDALYSLLGMAALILFFCCFIPSGKADCCICGTHGLKKDFGSTPSCLIDIAAESRPFHYGFYCPVCATKVAQAEEAIMAAKNRVPRQTWPATYKGKTPVIPGSEQPRVYSDWHKEKDRAKSQLLLTSAFLYSDINAIIEMDFERRTESSGNYQYTTWSASGVPCLVRQ